MRKVPGDARRAAVVDGRVGRRGGGEKYTRTFI